MNTTYRAARVPGKGWTVEQVTGSKKTGRVIERAPGFETLETYTLAQAQVCADVARREFSHSLNDWRLTMIYCNGTDYESIDAVRAEYPGAAEIVPVEAGWAVFATLTDLTTWEAQQ